MPSFNQRQVPGYHPRQKRGAGYQGGYGGYNQGRGSGYPLGNNPGSGGAYNQGWYSGQGGGGSYHNQGGYQGSGIGYNPYSQGSGIGYNPYSQGVGGFYQGVPYGISAPKNLEIRSPINGFQAIPIEAAIPKNWRLANRNDIETFEGHVKDSAREALWHEWGIYALQNGRAYGSGYNYLVTGSKASYKVITGCLGRGSFCNLVGKGDECCDDHICELPKITGGFKIPTCL